MTAKKTILVVDDDKFIQRSLEKVLDRAGYVVITAGTAAKGLQALRESNPDLLILDIQLPDMSGVGVVNEIRGQTGHSNVPILVLTGRLHMERFFDGMSRVGVIQKPFTTADLLDTIHRTLDSESANGNKATATPVMQHTFKTMILENDEAVMASLSATLKSAGFPVEALARGVGVIDQLTKAKPDVLLVNRILPGMNGDSIAVTLNRTPETQKTAIVMYDLSAMSRSAASLKERCPNIVAYLTRIDAGTVIEAVQHAGTTVRV